MITIRLCLAALLAAAALKAGATETENLNLRVLPVPSVAEGPVPSGVEGPAPGKVTIDGMTDDWDLSGGIFACGDVENARDQYAVWLHAMYDADNLYILARWIDPTPMNNPGSVKGDYGFRGDCLQVRFVTAPDVDSPEVLHRGQKDNDAPLERTSHWDCWLDRDGIDSLGASYGRRFNEGGPGDAKAQGAAQAFRKNDDGGGYVQELRFPWKLLTKEGLTLKPGDRMLMTFEPNFTLAGGGRLTIKDCFRPDVGVDRVFTFQGPTCWGVATLLPKGRVAPNPVRLSDGREFPVHLDHGVPVIDWTGLIKSREPVGFKTIKFTMPEDGYVSLNLWAPDGTVARQLLNAAFYAQGEHEVQWDGLTTWSFRQPGRPVEPGAYTWRGIWHKEFGLRLKGWACNGVSAPWPGPAVLDDWGGDHGNPVACAADDKQIYLGWDGAEGGKALVACGLDGSVKWRNLRGGIGSASLIAADGGTVYAVNRIGQYVPVAIYRVDAKTGGYTQWTDLKSTDLLSRNIWGDAPGIPSSPSALAAAGGRVFAAYSASNVVAVIDGESGRLLKMLPVEKPGDLEAVSAQKLFVISAGKSVLAVDVDSGKAAPVAAAQLEGDSWASALAVDKAGNLYVGIRNGSNQVQVFAPDGRLLRTIGRKGGRPLLGPWQPDGLLAINGLAVDATGKLWVAEDDGSPRRVSVWDTQTGQFAKEFFGATSYGAGGGAIDPLDPAIVVGQSCEWRLDPQSGRARCLGVITRDGMGNSRFGLGANGRLYLAVTPGSIHGAYPVRIFERLGDGHYKLRTVLYPPDRAKQQPIRVWADANDDGQEQPDEVQTCDLNLGAWIEGWYMPMTPDLSFYGTLYQIKSTGFTKCGAPEYDVSKAVKITDAANVKGRGGMGAQLGCGSADGRRMLFNGGYGEDHSTVDCYEIGTGQRLWTYPSNFTGVHGSHRAPGPEVGLIRGAFDICGSVPLPKPAGCIWVIPTNKGEWHVLTEDGFYLTKLFEGDPIKWSYPEKAVPGAVMDRCPPGAGEEAFGGSITLATNGVLYCQVGHTAFWNVEVTGLDTIRDLPSSGTVTIGAGDVATAQGYRDRALQASSGPRSLAVKKLTPAFTGNLAKDFTGAQIVSFQKNDGAGIKAVLAWDDRNLYAGWQVQDDTPWVNGADAPEYLYAHGDTVDLQLGTDPRARKGRAEAAAGDLRLSIGPFQGKPTAVLYRAVAAQKHPKSFSSGVVKEYVMDSVTVEDAVKVDVKTERTRKGYVVEAAIPLAVLGLHPSAGLVISGDLGVTHGNKEGNDTVLRTYWSNQETGIVSDEVFELKMTPGNWGAITFE